jgi:hypothetical protein
MGRSTIVNPPMTSILAKTLSNGGKLETYDHL